MKIKPFKLSAYTVLIALCIVFFDISIGHAQFRMEDLPKENQENLKKALDSYKMREKDELPDFVKKLKTIKINEDSEDDVLEKIGEPSGKNVLFGLNVWKYDFGETGVCAVEFDLNQKVAHIYFTKVGPNGVEMIYSNGNPQHGPNAGGTKNADGAIGTSSVAATAPSSPKEGQIYFNSTDKHFYGWNGIEWKQLD
jgi:hypothetical protein